MNGRTVLTFDSPPSLASCVATAVWSPARACSTGLSLRAPGYAAPPLPARSGSGFAGGIAVGLQCPAGDAVSRRTLRLDRRDCAGGVEAEEPEAGHRRLRLALRVRQRLRHEAPEVL